MVPMMPVMVMAVVMMMAMSGHPETLLDPAKPVPGRAADVAHILNQPAPGGGAELTGARQGHRVGASSGKRRGGDKRDDGGGSDNQATHWE